jgi:hypothetical protein
LQHVRGAAWPEGISASLNSKQEVATIYVEHGSAIRAPNLQTDRGIRIGSSLGDVKKAYPEAKPRPEYDGYIDYVVQLSRSRQLLFRTSEGRVAMLGLGSEPGSERDGCPAFAEASSRN